MAVQRIFARRTRCAVAATGNLMPDYEALAVALALVHPVATTERLDLIDATGRVLAGSVHVARSIPPFDAAAKDGHAVRLSDLDSKGPWLLPILGRARAGNPPTTLPPAGMLRVLTGAARPFGAKAVIPRNRSRSVVRWPGSAIVQGRGPRSVHVATTSPKERKSFQEVASLVPTRSERSPLRNRDGWRYAVGWRWRYWQPALSLSSQVTRWDWGRSETWPASP